MTRLLLDTHVWLWSLGATDQIAPKVMEVIRDADEVSLSVISIWEAVIKEAIGKLVVDGGVRAAVDEAVRLLGVRVLRVEASHTYAVADRVLGKMLSKGKNGTGRSLVCLQNLFLTGRGSKHAPIAARSLVRRR